MADRPGEADADAVRRALKDARRACMLDYTRTVDDADDALDRLTARLSEAERRNALVDELGTVASLTKALHAVEARLSEYEQALPAVEQAWRCLSECAIETFACEHEPNCADAARAALSGSTQTNHLHECRELNKKLTELITEVIDGEMGFRSTSDMRDFLLHGMENM